MTRVLTLAIAVALSAAAQGIITTVAGTDWVFPGDGKPALAAPLGTVTGVVQDAEGNIIFSDQDNCIIARLNSDGTVSVIAGNGVCDATGDGGPARMAGIGAPFSLAIDSQGNLYSGSNFDIRKITPGGTITTIAGVVSSDETTGGDGGPATQAKLLFAKGIVVDAQGNVYFSDSGNHRVRKIDTSGIITTVAGNGLPGLSGDGGPATSASLNTPMGITLDSQGRLLIADQHNDRVRRIAQDGTISTVVINVPLPTGLAFDKAGSLYISLVNGMLKATGNTLALFAGSATAGFSGDGGPATSALFHSTDGILVDSSGNVYVADSGNARLRKIDPSGTVNTVAGNGRFRYGGEGTPALATPLGTDLLVTSNYVGGSSILVDPSGALYVAEIRSNRVRKIANGVVNTFAGNGQSQSSGDGGPATAASMIMPAGLARDPAGNIYVSEGDGITVGKIRKVAPDGTITTFFTGLACPIITTDPAGNVYGGCLDATVRKFAANGTSTIVAGNQTSDFTGDGGPASKASLGLAAGLAVDGSGQIFIADLPNGRIRKVDTKGIITTIAGNGADTSTGDGGPAASSTIASPGEMVLDSAGNLFICELDGQKVRKIGTNGVISTAAGGGPPLVSGDGKPATSASVFRPISLAVDSAGDLFILDVLNSRIREVLATTPAVQVPQTNLSLTASSGGAPVQATFSVVGSIPGLDFQVAADTGGGPNWLTVSPALAATPRLIQVTADPSGLSPGAYHATITIRPAAALPSSLTLAVTLQVGAAQPSKLAADQPSLSFTFPKGAAPRSLSVLLSNTGSGTIHFTATTSSGRVTIAPASGSITPGKPVTVVVTGDPGGLPPGTYTDTLKIAGDNGQTLAIPVTVAISALSQALLLTQSGLSFTAVAQGGVVPPQSFGVVNPGSGTLSWTASTSTLTGGNGWLSVSPSSGSSTAGSPAPQVTVTINQAGLAPGRYYGLIRISAPGAANTPQLVTAFLEVLPAGSDPGAVVQPPELVFSTTSGRPSSQQLLVYGIGGSPKLFRTDHSASDFIFEVLPSDGVLDPAQPSSFVVQPAGIASDLYHFPPGTYSGTLTFQFADGTIQSVKVTVISVPTASPSAAAREGRRDGDVCSPQNLVLSLTSLGQSFPVSPGWPSAIGVDVRDNCGAPLTAGSVTASFSNSDPSISLESLNNGNWQATWQTGTSASNGIAVHLHADDPQHGIHGDKDIAATVTTQKDPPVLTSGSVGSAANFVAYSPLAPGGIVSIYGDRLADDTASNPGVPLPTQLVNTQVFIGGQSVPLFYVSKTQVNALVPFELNPNTRQQVLVQNGPTYSQPVPVDVGPAQPAAFLAGGNTIAVAYRGTQPGFLVSPSNPARAGDVLVIYCAGLGVTDQPVADGAASPSSPVANTQNPATVTIGGKSAQVQFAGLSPQFVGLYQINAVVPGGTGSGSVPLQITVAGQAGPAAPIAIQ